MLRDWFRANLLSFVLKQLLLTAVAIVGLRLGSSATSSTTRSLECWAFFGAEDLDLLDKRLGIAPSSLFRALLLMKKGKFTSQVALVFYIASRGQSKCSAVARALCVGALTWR